MEKHTAPETRSRVPQPPPQSKMTRASLRSALRILLVYDSFARTKDAERDDSALRPTLGARIRRHLTPLARRTAWTRSLEHYSGHGLLCGGGYGGGGAEESRRGDELTREAGAERTAAGGARAQIRANITIAAAAVCTASESLHLLWPTP